jgi:hypothetical protein
MSLNSTEPRGLAATEWVLLSSLGTQQRLRPAVPSHVCQLAEVLDRCPPLLAHRGTRQVLDGFMRYDAAMFLGWDAMPVTWVDGDDAEMVEVSMSANTSHGLPLTPQQRREGVDRLLGLRPGWSNARIARAAGTSESLVRRRRSPGPFVTDLDTRAVPVQPTTGGAVPSEMVVDSESQNARRQGVDGKTYPTTTLDLSDLLVRNPDASNRWIARTAGCSPSTVAAHRHDAATTGSLQAPPDRGPSPPGHGPRQSPGAQRPATSRAWIRLLRRCQRLLRRLFRRR